ncbi:MAG: YdcF family protein, partial [Oscillospiraceae bacterium]
VVGILLFVIVEAIIITGGFTNAKDNGEFMIILGCRLDGEVPGKCLKERLDAGALYLNKNPNTIVVVSGGQGDNEDVSEASAMRKYLLNKGISENRIFLEDKSHSTYENLVNSKTILDETFGGVKNQKPVILVTNNFHVYRSKAIAKAVGLSPTAISAKTPNDLKFPNYIREFASCMWWWAKSLGIISM